MKKEYLHLLLFVLGANKGIDDLLAQSSVSMTNNSAGIYLTYEDFETGKLTNEFKSYQSHSFLWAQGFFEKKNILLKTPDTTIIYKRSDIWGYTDHKGRLMRVHNKQHYKVLCDKGLIIYIIYSPTRTSYYFSKTLNDPICRLTRKNLTTIYADNAEILLKIHLTKKKHWLIWDENKDIYFINKLFLEQSGKLTK
jgi:hypothetical protein